MEKKKEVKVWDVLVRLFHWSLVTAFIIAYFTGEEESSWHINAGYTVLGLISFRIIWGFVGTQHARFSDFIYAPKQIIQYLKDSNAKKSKHYLGHNPAGGAMVVLLLISLFTVSISGLKVYAIEEGRGPLASANEITMISSSYADEHEDDEEGEEFWEETHEIATYFTLLLIFLHILGVIVSSKLHNENLIKAMITGKKNID
jgi:cytochrome b